MADQPSTAGPAGGSDAPLAVVDIDGVVADVRHRLHHIRGRRKDWDAFFAAAADDPPHAEGLAVVARLAADHEVVFLTGRPEHLRADTQAWLDAHGIGGHRLLMRRRSDRRPAVRAKLELLRRLARGRRVAVVVDDDPAVISALDAAGYPTFHADWEQLDEAEETTLRKAQEVEGRT